MSDDEDNIPETHDLGSQARKQLGNLIETLESLTEEKKQLSERIKAEFAEAASSGYDKLAIKQILKDRAADAQKSIELRAITASYRRAIAGLVGTPLGDWGRSWLAQEARINKPTNEKSPEMEAFMKGRKAKAAPEDDAGEARA